MNYDRMGWVTLLAMAASAGGTYVGINSTATPVAPVVRSADDELKELQIKQDAIIQYIINKEKESDKKVLPLQIVPTIKPNGAKTGSKD